MATANITSALAIRVPEAAARAGVSTPFMWNLVYSGTIPSLKIGARRLILVTDLVAFLQAQRDLEANRQDESADGLQGN